MSTDIFVSYSHEDRVKVLRLVRVLEDRGWTIWWDQSIVPGYVWDRTISKELRAASCVIVVWSSSSIKSDYVREEAGIALAHGKLLPISIDKTAPPDQFGGIEVLDFSRWLGADNDPNFQLLEEGLQNLSKKETTPKNLLGKNRSKLKIWGISIGGKFFGFVSGVIAQTLPLIKIGIAVTVASLGGVLVYDGFEKAYRKETISTNSSDARSARKQEGSCQLTEYERPRDGTVWFGDAGSGRLLHALHHGNRVNIAAFSPDGTRIVTASWDGTAQSLGRSDQRAAVCSP